MTLRTYSGLLVLETLFDSIPTTNPDLVGFADLIFNPQTDIVESDCTTSLGEIVDVNFELEGKVELSTGLPISRARIEQLLSNGIYKVATRSLSTCISGGGVCQSCYHASRPKDPIPKVGSIVSIKPEYQVGADAIPVIAGDTRVLLSQTPDLYDRLYVYYEGALLNSGSYSVSGSTLTFNSPIPRTGNVVTRFTTITRSPFLSWLADTYSGAMLGMKPLPYPKLPIRKSLISSYVPETRLQLLSDQISSLKAVPPEVLGHLQNIQDNLEKALFVIAIHSIYLNVSS